MTKDEELKMKKADKLHSTAMDLIEESIVARFRDHDAEKAKKLQQTAYLKASKAADIMRDIFIEPSRAIAFRSAASIAGLVGKWDEMMELSRVGLLGNPPKWVANDLHAIRGDLDEISTHILDKKEEKE